MSSSNERSRAIYRFDSEAPLLIRAAAVERTMAGFPCVVCKEPGERSEFRLFALGGVHFPIHEQCRVRCARCKKPMSEPLFAKVLLLDLPDEERTVWVPRHEHCPIFIPRHAQHLTYEQEAIHLKEYLSVEEMGT